MGSYTVYCFQMLRMHQKSCKLIAILVQTEEYADAYVIDTALHGSIHGFRMITIVMLRSGWVELFIAFLMIGFLEQDIGTDTGFLKLTIIFHGGCRNVYIDTADISIFMMDTVNGFNALQNVLNGVVNGILSRL